MDLSLDPLFVLLLNFEGQSPSVGGILLWILERVIVPSLIVYVFALLVQRHIAVRDMRTQIVTRCLSQISELDESCAEYWLKDRDDQDLILEEKIEALLLEVIDLRGQCVSERIVLEQDAESFSDEDLIEIVSGAADFRSATRKRNPDIARNIAQALLRLRRSIFEGRRNRLALFPAS